MKDVELIQEYKLFSIKVLGKVLKKKPLGETTSFKKPTVNVKTSDMLCFFFRIVFLQVIYTPLMHYKHLNLFFGHVKKKSKSWG